MENDERSFGKWLSYVAAGVGRGTRWLFFDVFWTIPLTVIVLLLNNHISLRTFIMLAGAMLIDGYRGNREAEQKKLIERESLLSRLESIVNALARGEAKDVEKGILNMLANERAKDKDLAR